jgi:hypothetical protein
MDTTNPEQVITELLEIKPVAIKGLPGLYLPNALGILAKNQILTLLKKVDAVHQKTIDRTQGEAAAAQAKGEEYQGQIGNMNSDEVAERTAIYMELLEPIHKQYKLRFQPSPQAPEFIGFEQFAEAQTEPSILALAWGLFGMARDPNA